MFFFLREPELGAHHRITNNMIWVWHEVCIVIYHDISPENKIWMEKLRTNYLILGYTLSSDNPFHGDMMGISGNAGVWRFGSPESPGWSSCSLTNTNYRENKILVIEWWCNHQQKETLGYIGVHNMESTFFYRDAQIREWYEWIWMIDLHNVIMRDLMRIISPTMWSCDYDIKCRNIHPFCIWSSM